jgi:DNA-binding transcriptional LysR family regulator
MLFPLLGQWAAECAHRRWLRRTVIGTAALVLAAVTIIGTQTRFDWLGPALAAFTRKDPTIEGIDWVSLRTDLTARGLALPGLTVGVPNWRDAGKIAHALGPSVTVLCLSPDARQFGFADPPAAHIGQDILLLIPDHADRVVAGLARNFERIDPLPPISVRLGDRVLQNVAVYQGHHLLAWP